MSFVSKLETDAITVAEKVKAGVEAAGNDAVKLAAWLGNNSAEITALAGLAGTGASTVTSTALSLLNTVINAVKDAGDAASSNGLSVSLDSSVIADVKAVIAAIEKV